MSIPLGRNGGHTDVRAHSIRHNRIYYLMYLFVKQMSGAPRTPSGTLGNCSDRPSPHTKVRYLKKGRHKEALAEGATSSDVPSDRGGARDDHLRSDLGLTATASSVDSMV